MNEAKSAIIISKYCKMALVEVSITCFYLA